MTDYLVTKKVDAYVNYQTVVTGADSPEEARAEARDYAFTEEWVRADVEEFDDAEIFVDEIVPFDPAIHSLENIRSIAVSETEHATILAALRYWQRDVEADGENFEFGDYWEGKTPLTAEQIDVLCERINR